MKRLILILGVVALLASVSSAAILVDLGARNRPAAPETDGRYYSDNAKYAWGKYIGPGWGPFVYWASGSWNAEPDCIESVTGAQTIIGIESLDLISTLAWSPNKDPNATVLGYPDNVADGVTINKAYMDVGDPNVNPNSEGGAFSLKFTDVPWGTYDLKVLYGCGVNNTWEFHAGTVTANGTSASYMCWEGGPAQYGVLNVSGIVPVAGEIQIDVTTQSDPNAITYASSKPDPNDPNTWTHRLRTEYACVRTLELIPEPATMCLLALGGLVAIRRRR